MAKQSYLPIFLLLVLTAVLHIAAVTFYLYWDFWWFDIVVHFFGGVWIAASIVWVYYFSGWFTKPVVRWSRFFTISLVSAIIVGCVWELFEFKAGITFVMPGVDYTTDTIADLAMDVVGALSAYLYYRLVYWKLFI